MIFFRMRHRLLSSVRILLSAYLIFLASTPCARSATYDVTFNDAKNSAAVHEAIIAIRKTTDVGNVPISAISATFVKLTTDDNPQLLVHLSGGFCGSAGCAIMLFERGTDGWIRIGNWLAGYVSVSDVRDAGWLRLILNHTAVWRHTAIDYELIRQ